MYYKSTLHPFPTYPFPSLLIHSLPHVVLLADYDLRVTAASSSIYSTFLLPSLHLLNALHLRLFIRLSHKFPWFFSTIHYGFRRQSPA